MAAISGNIEVPIFIMSYSLFLPDVSFLTCFCGTKSLIFKQIELCERRGTSKAMEEKKIGKKMMKEEAWHALLRISVKAAVITTILWLTISVVFGIISVRNMDMSPSLKDGDLVFFYRLEPSYDMDDVIVYTAQGERHIGRVCALPGDKIEINRYGQLIVNGMVQVDETGQKTYEAENGAEFPLNVEKETVFVLNDNRDEDKDSRTYGNIPLKAVEGRVMILLRHRNF